MLEMNSLQNASMIKVMSRELGTQQSAKETLSFQGSSNINMQGTTPQLTQFLSQNSNKSTLIHIPFIIRYKLQQNKGTQSVSI